MENWIKTDVKQQETKELELYLGFCYKKYFQNLTLWCLVVTKRSHILKQTWSQKLPDSLSMCDLFITTRR